jgi:hypothetical protein
MTFWPLLGPLINVMAEFVHSLARCPIVQLSYVRAQVWHFPAEVRSGAPGSGTSAGKCRQSWSTRVTCRMAAPASSEAARSISALMPQS